MSSRFDNISRILGVLVAERESYSYVDKVGYAPSRDTLLFYLKEAFRDFNSLLSSGFENTTAGSEAKRVNLREAERELLEIESINDRRKLREVSSLISSRALLIAARLMGREEGGGE